MNLAVKPGTVLPADPQAVVRVVRDVIGRPGPIKLHPPSIGFTERAMVAECMRVDPVGYHYLDRFERKLEQVCGVQHAVSMVSGTAALHVALLVHGVKPGDEVLVPSLTFAASADAVTYCGATPHFVDTSFNLTLDVVRECLRKNPRIRAVMSVDLLGVPCVDLSAVTREFGVALIQDAAESMGEFCGITSDCAVVSFNNNKFLTANGGGAILTNSPTVAAMAKNLRHHQRIKHRWFVECAGIGYNYDMSNICAALALAQLERIEELKAARERLTERYAYALAGVVGTVFWACPWLNLLMVENRDEVLAALHADGIEARAVFTPLHLTVPYSGHPRSHPFMPESMDTWRRGICLPSGPGLLQ